MWKKLILGLIILFVIIQFIKPERNLSADHTNHIATAYTIPQDVEVLLQNACYDCHSNETRYPWYVNLQPVAWFLADHVNEGKQKLNFSEFTTYNPRKQAHKLEEVAEMVREKEMPLDSYTYFGLHKEANLTDAERQTLITWANGVRSEILAKNPAAAAENEGGERDGRQ